MLVRWNPYREMNSLQREINNLFADFKSEGGKDERGAGGDGAYMPAVDISENDKEFLLKAWLPGMEQKDIDVSLEENRLTIKGEKKEEKEEKGENYIRKEISSGSFYRAFNLTVPVKEDEIKASYKNGILELVLPKEEKAKPKKIEIK